MGKFFEAKSRTSFKGKFKIKELLVDKVDENTDVNAMLSEDEYIVIWYREISNASNRNNSTKLVEVVFENKKTGYQLRRKIPLVAMGSFPIGSIWKNGKSTEKVEFDSFSTIFKGDYSNVTYSTNKKIKGNEIRFINQDNYPVFNINNESNTMIVVHQNDIDYVIHPLLFFNALYGVSNHINRVLLTYTWAKVEEYLALNITDRANPEAVVIPKLGVVGDAVFLHYLKHDGYTKRVVRKLHSSFRANIAGNGSSPLCVESYHNQDIEIVNRPEYIGEWIT
ncbi:hypothetical protein [Psychrobacter sp. H7-1]|uniref:hypothetical protein n=1 Tax=Psychrobacter sp. H7-1 TaxID=1569265 RepID=UPI001918930F|nr:hypothetical protein [Psychrobacter sp. H7-1]